MPASKETGSVLLKPYSTLESAWLVASDKGIPIASPKAGEC